MAKYCPRCGSSVGVGDNFCSNCSKRLASLPDATNFNFQSELFTPPSFLGHSTGKTCPRCEGKGKCARFDNLNGPAQGIVALFTLGIGPIAMQGLEECELCGGTGRVDEDVED